MTDNPKKAGKWSWFWILLFLFVLFSAILSTFGIHLFEKTEEVEVIEHPHR